MAVRRLNHAVLYVHGLQRTVDFYRTALGFEVRLEIPGRAASPSYWSTISRARSCTRAAIAFG